MVRGAGGRCGDRSVSVKDRTPKQVSVRQTVRQTEYIKSGWRAGGHPAGWPAGRSDVHLSEAAPRTKNAECTASRLPSSTPSCHRHAASAFFPLPQRHF